VIIEPVVGNMGCVPPREGYLEAVRGLTAKHGALLIFDEVMTGFRLARGGAQERYGIRPDITTLGKIIGGGLPVGAYGGSREVMNHIAPAGPVYQAGTLSGNPLSMTAGLVTLRRLRDKTIYETTRKLIGPLVRRTRARRAGGGTDDSDQSRRLNVDQLLHCRCSCRLGKREQVRPRAVRKVLPRDVGRGRLSRALAIRSGVRKPCAYGRDY
jgi:hypothetical protein